ncbi:MAG: DUF4062 domain-containing protein [Candidatus Eisenbacteria bacterium]
MEIGGERPEVDRKYQVFISSTFRDLWEHRRAAARAVIDAGHLPVCLENYAPDTKDKETVIRRAVKSSQYFVLIIGHRYGTRPLDKDGQAGLGYVEIELAWAQECGLPIIAFLLDADEARAEREKLSGPKEAAELSNEDLYWNLRKRFEDHSDQPYCVPFTSSAQIDRWLYGFFSKRHDVPGYILEQDMQTSDVLRVYAKHQGLRDIVSKLGEFKTVEGRLSTDKSKKEALAAAFEEVHGADIQEKYERIFIESGSTLFHVSLLLAQRLPTRAESLDHRPRPSVLTNNALAHIYLWLCSGVMCHPAPEGPPDEKYAGMYGPLTNRNRPPDYSLRPLAESDPDAEAMIDDVVSQVFGDESTPQDTLILAAMSGLQLGEEIQAMKPETKRPYSEDQRVLGDLQSCRGFHVGSYSNKLFKRCLYRVKAPTIVFMHDSKIDCPVEVGKCHFIFDRAESWQDFIREHPLSLWIGCTNDSMDGIISRCQEGLNEGDWEFCVYDRTAEYPVVIGHNRRFREACQGVGVSPKS